ncbi:MAG: SpaA isopeptide-forming pilin-related protein, partial [Kurthia sp.]
MQVEERDYGVDFYLDDTQDRHYITFKTSMVKPFKEHFLNTATLYWGNKYQTTSQAKVDVPKEVLNNGYKQGSKVYNDKTGEYTFKWQVGFNLNKNGVGTDVIKDRFTTENMELVKGSVKIVEVDLKKNKSGRTLTNPLKELSSEYYTVEDNEHGFTVKLQGSVPNKAYALVYETKDSDGHYNDTYTNKATSESLFGKEKVVEDTVYVDNGGLGISKYGSQDEKTRHFDYSVDVNKSKSILKNAYVTDELSAVNKLDGTYVEGSFKLDGDSKKLTITKDANQKADDSTYYLYVNEDKTSFKLIFPKSMHTTHNLSYKVYYEGDKDSVLSNAVKLVFDNQDKTLSNGETKDITYRNNSEAFGWGVVVYKDIYIKKVDSVTGKLLKGAKFDLYKFDDHSTVYRTATTDENGIAVFKNVRLKSKGDSPYSIKEVVAPKNYVEDTRMKNINVAEENQNEATPFVIENERKACEVTVSFVDAKDKEKIEKDGTYTVFTKDKVETKQKVEFKDGEAKVNLKPGTYFIKQDGDIKGIAPVNEFTEIKVEEDADGECKVTTVNVELVKVCETVILSTDKDTGKKITANSEYKVLKDGKEFNPSVKSDDKGNIDLGKLENGKYELVQTKAPKGYVL